jgi:hypothetical protein
MPIIRLLIAGIMLILGLLAAAAVMLVGVIFYMFQRLRGRPAPRPAFRRPTPTRPRPMRTSEVIDVEVTEIKN